MPAVPSATSTVPRLVHSPSPRSCCYTEANLTQYSSSSGGPAQDHKRAEPAPLRADPPLRQDRQGGRSERAVGARAGGLGELTLHPRRLGQAALQQGSARGLEECQ